jgi:hypothetical protein
MSKQPDILLVVTAGLSDLQPLVERVSDGKRMRAQLHRGVRFLHERLLDGSQPWRIETSPDYDDLTEIRLAPTVNDLATPIWLDAEQKDCVEYVRGDQGELILIAPKLVGVWRKLAASPGRLRAMLLLTTERVADSPHGKEEPIALGKVLGDWFAQLPGEQRPAITIQTYLRDRETLESNGTSPVAPEIADRIEQAVRKQVRNQPDATLWLAVTGGLPQVKELIAAAARLHARRVASAYHTETGAEGMVTLSPVESLRARRVALHYVRRGGFVEAHAAAFEFHADRSAQRWVAPLDHVASLFNQNPTYLINRGTLKEDTHPESLKHIAEHWRIRCLLPALRAEAALQAGRWLEAMNWTLTFHDAAFLDCIASLPGVTLNDRNRQIEFNANQPPDPRLIDAGCLLDPNEDRLPPEQVRKRNLKKYKYNAVGRLVIDAWAAVLGLSSLDQLRLAVNKTEQISIRNTEKTYDASPAHFRNINTHNTLSSREIDDATQLFVDRGLWNVAPTRQGDAFLAQPVIGALLRDLLPNVAEPADLYRELVRDLIARLLDPSAVINGAGRDRSQPPVQLDWNNAA